MKKGLRRSIVLCVVTALSAALPVLSQEPVKGNELVAPQPPMLHRSPEMWMKVVEARYLKLADLLAKKDWGGIAELYGPEMGVYSKKFKTRYMGGHEIAFHFWQTITEMKDLGPISVAVKSAEVFPVHIPTPCDGVPDYFNEIAVVTGSLKAGANPGLVMDFRILISHIHCCPILTLSEIY